MRTDKLVAGEDIKKGDVLLVMADGVVIKASVATGPLFSDNMSEAEKNAARQGLEGLGEK